MDNTTNNETTMAPTEQVKRGRPYLISPEVFSAAWAAAATLDEVATNLGITKVSASVKASQLRRKGFELPMFKRGRKAVEPATEQG